MEKWIAVVAAVVVLQGCGAAPGEDEHGVDYGDTGYVSTGDNVATCDAPPLCRVYDPENERDGCCTCPDVSNGTWRRYMRNPTYAICRE